jgi:thiosulfate dehydrogenase [quinone] large subunit
MRRLLDKAMHYAPLYLRLALGLTFLTAVSDRFGIWGPPGAPNVAWGDFEHFLAYAAILNPYLPPSFIPPLGWFVTVAETVLGVALIAGYRVQTTAFLSGFLLLAFAFGMTIGGGIKAPLNYSVFSASAGAFLLAAAAGGRAWAHDTRSNNLH